MTETWFAAFTKSLEAPATPLEALAEALTRRRAINPVLLHRDILRQVEQRQADAMDDGTDVTTRTGKLVDVGVSFADLVVREPCEVVR